MPKIIELPDGEEVEFPDEMGDDDIRAILQKKFGAPSPFPGMPKSLQPDKPTDFTKPLPGGSITNIADFQRQQNEREVPPPPMLRRLPGEEKPAEFPPGDEAYPRMSLPRLEHFSPDTPEGVANMAMATLAGGAGLGALRGIAGQAATRIPAAAEGYHLGSKGARAIGAPGPVGGIPGAVMGAINPGATIAAGVGEAAGTAAGGEAAGIPMALAAMYARKKLGPLVDVALKARGASAIPAEVKAAETVARAGRALSPEKEAVVAASRAAREAKAAEAVATKARVAKEMSPRVREGAERVGRQVGKSKEQIRMETGPVFNEAQGAASPFLPSRVEQDIIDKMRSMPPGEMRKAYVLAAKDPKTQVIAEQMRRFMERVGIAVPIVAGAGMAAGQE